MDVWRRRSTSAKRAGSSNAREAPCSRRRSRRRARTRSRRSAVTASIETSLAKIVADARPDLDVRADGGDDAIALLEAEEDLVGAGLPEDVLDGVAPFDLALARLIGIAVLGVLRHRAVTPVPLDAGAVVLLIIVGAVLDVDDKPHS